MKTSESHYGGVVNISTVMVSCDQVVSVVVTYKIPIGQELFIDSEGQRGSKRQLE